MKPPMTSAVAMYAYLLHREQMNHETNINKWQKEKELVRQLKKTIIKINRKYQYQLNVYYSN